MVSPSRPNPSLAWMLSPLRVVCVLLWRQYRWHVLGIIGSCAVLMFVALVLYTLPGAISERLINPRG